MVGDRQKDRQNEIKTDMSGIYRVAFQLKKNFNSGHFVLHVMPNGTTRISLPK